jgi:hypothetical protein
VPGKLPHRVAPYLERRPHDARHREQNQAGENEPEQ